MCLNVCGYLIEFVWMCVSECMRVDVIVVLYFMDITILLNS